MFCQNYFFILTVGMKNYHHFNGRSKSKHWIRPSIKFLKMPASLDRHSATLHFEYACYSPTMIRWPSWLAVCLRATISVILTRLNPLTSRAFFRSVQKKAHSGVLSVRSSARGTCMGDQSTVILGITASQKYGTLYTSEQV